MTLNHTLSQPTLPTIYLHLGVRGHKCDIHCAFNDNSCLEVRSIYLDMSKAFDKVWHEGLLHKLKQNGIDGKLLAFFKNYLSDRKQRVVLNGQASEERLIV